MEFEISMVVSTENNPVDHKKFADMFIDWVESNGWYCGGGIFPPSEEKPEEE